MITRGEQYGELMDHLRGAQENCANLSHLNHAEFDDKRRAELWLHLSELFKELQVKVTDLAKGKSQ